MATTTFTGPVRSLNGFISFGDGAVVTPPAFSTLVLTPAEHAGRIIRVTGPAGTIRLPTINDAASGGGYDSDNNLGVTYTFVMDIVPTNLKIATDGVDKFFGTLSTASGVPGATILAFSALATNDNINFNGGTTGGLASTIVRVTAVARFKYFVEGFVLGATATPFADV